MLSSPSSGRLRTISTRSDLRIEDEIDGQRSTWVVLRMPPIISFVVLCIARGIAKLLTKVYSFAASLTPWVIFAQLTQSFVKLVMQQLEDASPKSKVPEPVTVTELAQQIVKLKETIAKLNLENRSLKAQQQSLLDEISDIRSGLETLEEASKQMKFAGITSPRTSLARELAAEGFPQGDGPLNSSLDLLPVKASNNPKATVETSIDEFQTKLSCFYDGKALAAWLRPPRENDSIIFAFHEPVCLERFKIGTGHYEYPINTLTNADVEILFADSTNYTTIGRFNQWGLAEGNVSNSRPVKSLRIKIRNSSSNWIILSEVTFETVTEDQDYESP